VRVAGRRCMFASVVVATSTLLGLSAPGCGSSNNGSGAPATDAAIVDERSRLDAPIHPDAACLVTIDEPPIVAALHVDVGTPVHYESNPPSSGPHYQYWAAFQAFSTAVDPRYWVHDLEHGAIVLLYKCDAADGCPAIVTALQRVADAIPDDPLCDKASGVRVRVVITPDPDLDVPIAAASWGWTYRAACLDAPTLTRFALEHYAQGGENLCVNGIQQF
jgi:hypothetical protein